MTRELLAVAVALLLAAVPLVAQEPEPPGGEVPRIEVPEHDFQFALAATEEVPDASGQVFIKKAEEGAEDGNAFTVIVNGLPDVDEFDAEGRDVEAYTVWVVPSKDRMEEASLAGVLEVSEDGSGRFEGTTPLESFGVLVVATAPEATELKGVVPVLTGIPAAAAPEAPEGVEGVPPTPAPPDAPAPTPETPDQPTPEQNEPQYPTSEAPDQPAPEMMKELQ